MNQTKRDDCRDHAQQLIAMLEIALREADSLIGVGDEQSSRLGKLTNSIFDAIGQARHYVRLREQM